ncbi:MAG: aminoglycoside phosphotransferase [Rhodoferax sp.]|nr:aminoglycoside phosphotransferase [Rhodoferax sp.]
MSPESHPHPDSGTPSASAADARPAGAEPLVWADPARRAHFDRWLEAIAPRHGLEPGTVRMASADASFRRYLRVDGAQGSRIIMDAPPDKENCAPFVQVATLLQQAGLLAPQVLEWQAEQGFMLLTDLGDRTMMSTLDPQQPQAQQALYLQAVDTLVTWQVASRPGVLPPYDEALLRRELGLFPEWYLGHYRRHPLTDADRKVLETAFSRIVARNLASPSVYVHRDFMPRNLMVTDAGLAVLDFQDAVYGPITYDIASLMRDAFLSWDDSFCLDITVRYWERARRAGLPVGDDFGAFFQAVDYMALQRHLKVAGIFARLTLRDGKPKYLADTPRFIAYIRATCGRYDELRPLLRLLDRVEGVTPASGYAFGRL